MKQHHHHKQQPLSIKNHQQQQQHFSPKIDHQLIPFSSLVRDHLKLKLEFPSLQFIKRKKNSSQGGSSSSRLLTTKDIHDKILQRISGGKCDEINTGEDTLFKLTFSCQDSQPMMTGDDSHTKTYIEKNRIQYPKKIMPIDCLKIQVEFHYNISISEFPTKIGNRTEEEIVNSLITIIDLDDHQVYFKVKTNYFKSTTNEEEHPNEEPLDRYIVIGKMDHSQHAFIFDVNELVNQEYSKPPRNLKQIYEYCMPQDLANYFKKSTTNGNLKISNSDKSVLRVGFGMFFRNDTIAKRNKYRRYWGNPQYNEDRSVIGVVKGTTKCGDYGLAFLVENAYPNYPRTVYSGVVDVGYYTLNLQGWYSYYSSTPSHCYTCKLTQEVRQNLRR